MLIKIATHLQGTKKFLGISCNSTSALAMHDSMTPDRNLILPLKNLDGISK
ncbi:hypothetical protein [Erythrobacter sp. T5W1-R]|uniref:hypothetical protein n=1 Tax=Erythrobacter sp. T5W1-R TaxID=3101752 RepID=UPI002B002345|nr:hypothetical protein [Erythrobacter sp. T5W1-R]